ncbi:MAG: cupin domain-containing protein [Actinomycetota bacterium]|jgi:quercetin dioxygenase-like cupin family protein|nr:cupin domain-containing protein [Actinomycetota bacterium]
MTEAADPPPGATFADLASVVGVGGAVWSLPHGGDLDANLVRLEPGGAIGEHVNVEVDVLISVQAGEGLLAVDGTQHRLAADRVALVPKGVSRSIEAGPAGLTYLSVHRGRGPLDIGPSRR